jgi:hypothetical protein
VDVSLRSQAMRNILGIGSRKESDPIMNVNDEKFSVEVNPSQSLTMSISSRNNYNSYNNKYIGEEMDVYNKSFSLKALSSKNPLIIENTAALALYYKNYGGLQSVGPSGMTILEELIDACLKVCENSRQAGHRQHSRSAILLSSSGKTYTGCEISFPGDDNFISAEKAAFLAAAADGSTNFEVSSVIY